jgi:hypothetical protein
MARGRGSRNYYSRGKYRYTAKRAAALKRAQAISARKRKGKGGHKPSGGFGFGTAAKFGGVLAGVAAVGYVGHRYGGTISKSVGDGWKSTFSPQKREAVRTSNPVSGTAAKGRSISGVLSNPKTGQPFHVTHVPQISDEAMNEIRGDIAKDKLAPHLGGPDHRIYDANGNVDTEAMVSRSVRATQKKGKGKNARARRKAGDETALTATQRASRAGVLGKKTNSLQGTPGGTKTYPPADPKSRGLTDAEMEAAFAMDTSTPYKPIPTRSRSVGTPTASKVEAAPKTSPAPKRSVQSKSAKRVSASQITEKRLARMNFELNMEGDRVKNWDILDPVNRKATRRIAERYGLVITSRGVYRAPGNINYYEGDE